MCSWHMWATLHQVLPISNPWLPLRSPLCLCHHRLSTRFLPQFHTIARVPQQATLSISVLILHFPAAARGIFLKTRMRFWSRTKSLGLWSCMGLTLPVRPLVGGRGTSAATACTKGGAPRKSSLASRWQNPEWQDGQSASQGLPVKDPLAPPRFPSLLS